LGVEIEVEEVKYGGRHGTVWGTNVSKAGTCAVKERFVTFETVDCRW